MRERWFVERPERPGLDRGSVKKRKTGVMERGH